MPQTRKRAHAGADGYGDGGSPSTTPFKRGAETTRDHNAWLDDAACRGVPSAIFFPSYPERQSLEEYQHRYDRAAALCASCPVRDECSMEAFRTDLAFGAHGYQAGMTPEEREKSKVRACPGCGEPFLARKRQKWCDKPNCQYQSRRQGAQANAARSR